MVNHHHIGLNTRESAGGSPPPPGTTGLFHRAILYPTRATPADALRRILDAGISLDGASDHGVSETLYPPRPRPERRRVVLGPAQGTLAPHPRGHSGDVHTASRPPGIAGRAFGHPIGGCLVFRVFRACEWAAERGQCSCVHS